MSSVVFIFFWFIGVFLFEGLFPHIRRERSRWRHTFVQVAIATFSGAIQLIFFFTVIPYTMVWVEDRHLGIIPHIPAWWRVIAAFVLFDLWMYWWHRANHRIPLLWRFHRAHHNDIDMDSLTAWRFHPGEVFISLSVNMLIVAVFGLQSSHLIVYNAVFLPVILLHHSNVALPEAIDRLLRMFIVTPNMHRVHHSIETQETDSNYGSVFSFWDRLSFSFKKRKDTRAVTFGLPYFREPRWQGIAGFLRIPFIKVESRK